ILVKLLWLNPTLVPLLLILLTASIHFQWMRPFRRCEMVFVRRNGWTIGLSSYLLSQVLSVPRRSVSISGRFGKDKTLALSFSNVSHWAKKCPEREKLGALFADGSK
ncbi:hypothetical protein TorRG33x02_101290, partial [Trema orientale]